MNNDRWGRAKNTILLAKPEVRIISDLCKGCGLCIEACPPRVLKFADDINCKGYHYVFYTGDYCTGCGVCYHACPEFDALAVYKKGAALRLEEIK